jgi:hypothetical protein
MNNLETRLTELTSQVQLLHEQCAVLQAQMYFLEALLLFFLVSVVGMFLWRKNKDYQAIKGSSYMRTRVAPPSDHLQHKKGTGNELY